jgi:signal transduction histidine kinase
VKDQVVGKTWDIAASLFSGARADDKGIILVVRDISRIVELQESLRRSETMSALGQLVAGVAHEVRNPLFGISATLDAFESRLESSEGRERYVQILRTEVDRLSELMQDLLDYGKPPNLEVARGNISEVVTQAVNSCLPLAQRGRVNVVNKVNDDLAPLLMDTKRLAQAFRNLVENAIQHSPAGEEVIIEGEAVTENEQAWVRCCVKDRGPGIPEEDKSRIFEPFFTRRRGGTGLGLPIVQRIIEQHGGGIRISNRAEGGTHVTVVLPLTPPTTAGGRDVA